MILMLSTGLLKHVIVIPILLDAAKRDAWISVLLACGLTLVWAAFLYAGMAKLNKRHLFDWLAKAYHPIVGRMLAVFIGLYLFAICAVTTRDTVYWIHLTFSPETPIMIFSVPSDLGFKRLLGHSIHCQYREPFAADGDCAWFFCHVV